MNISLKTKSNNIYKNLMSKPNLEKLSKISERKKLVARVMEFMFRYSLLQKNKVFF